MKRVRQGGRLGLALLLAALAIAGLVWLEVDNSPRAFFVGDDRLLESLGEMQALFGGGPMVRLVWSGEALWTEEGLAWLEQATREVAAVAGVVTAHGPLGLDSWWMPPTDPTEPGERLRNDPLARAGGWVGADGGSASLLVELEKNLPRFENLRALEALEEIVEESPAALEGVVVGLPVIERAMDRSLARLVRRIFPGIGILCALLLFAACRNTLDAALPLALAVVAEAMLFGLMGWSRVPVNLITSILVPILFVIGMVTATHLQMRFRVHRGGGCDPRTAARRALADRAWAILWAGFTTAVAFGSMAFSPLPPIRSLGLWTATGIGLIVVCAFAIQVPAMARFGSGSAVGGRGFDRLGHRLGEGLATRAASRRGPVVAAMALLAVVAAAGIPRLEMESGLLDYFRPHHPVSVGFERVSALGVGPASAELVLRLRSAEESFRDPDRLERLAELTEMLRSEPRVVGALGAGDLFRAAGRRMTAGGPVSDSMRWLVLGLLQTESDARRRFEQMVTPDGRVARVTLLLPVTSHSILLPALERAAERARTSFPEASVEWTGDYPLVLLAQRDLLETMAASLGVTVLVVALTMVFLTRAMALWAAVMAANLWPLLLAGGVMGWAGIPLDSTTVMIAAVVLGIAVDDSLHTLGELRATGGEVAVAIGRVAPAQLLTTVILGLGFASCALSEFLPIARFGLVTAVALVAALAGDWLLLPALLGHRAPNRSVTSQVTPSLG